MLDQVNFFYKPGIYQHLIWVCTFILMIGCVHSCGDRSSEESTNNTPSPQIEPEETTPSFTTPPEPIEEPTTTTEEQAPQTNASTIPYQGAVIQGGKGGIVQQSNQGSVQYFTPSQPGVDMPKSVQVQGDVVTGYGVPVDADQGGVETESETLSASDGAESDELSSSITEDPSQWTVLSKIWDTEPCAIQARRSSSYGTLCAAERITLFGRAHRLRRPQLKGGSVSFGQNPDHWMKHNNQPLPTTVFKVKRVLLTPNYLRVFFSESLLRIILDGSDKMRHPISTRGVNFYGSLKQALNSVPSTTTISHLSSGQHYDVYLSIEKRQGNRCVISFALIRARTQKFAGYYFGSSYCYL